VIAASWERDRARELRGRCYSGLVEYHLKGALVPPSTLTTFYVGALGNSSQCTANVSPFIRYALVRGSTSFVAPSEAPFRCIFHCFVRPVSGAIGRVQLLATVRYGRHPGEHGAVFKLERCEMTQGPTGTYSRRTPVFLLGASYTSPTGGLSSYPNSSGAMRRWVHEKSR
jgi:hypothetical protein